MRTLNLNLLPKSEQRNYIDTLLREGLLTITRCPAGRAEGIENTRRKGGGMIPAHLDPRDTARDDPGTIYADKDVERRFPHVPQAPYQGLR